MKKVQCVILAGGLGTRIRDRSGDLPKALIPIRGRPFLAYQLKWLASQNVRNVVLSVGYRGDLISKAIGNGSLFGVSVSYADEGHMLRGTGGALRHCAELGLLESGFFVLNGDSYLSIDLQSLWRFSENGKIPTMSVLRNEGRWDKSNVCFEKGKTILYDKFGAHPEPRQLEYIDYGICVLTRDLIIQKIQPGAVIDIAGILYNLSVKGGLRGYEVFDRFYEIGSPQGLDDFEAYVRAKGL